MNEFATYLSVFSAHLHVYALVLVILECLKVTMALNMFRVEPTSS